MDLYNQDFDHTEEELWDRFSQTDGLEHAEASLILADAVFRKERYDQTLALCELALEIYESNRESVVDSDFANIYQGMSYSLKGLGRMGEGAALAQKAAEIVEDTDPSRSATLFRQASELWYEDEDWMQTIECSQKASQQLDPEITLFMIGQDFFNVGLSYYGLRNYESAIQNFQSSREYLKRAKNPTGVARCDEELAKCYLKIDNAVGSEKHASLALDYANISCDNDRQRISNYLYGRAKKLSGDYEAAEKYLNLAQYMLTVGGSKDWVSIILTEEALAEVFMLTDRAGEANEILRRIETIRSTMVEDETDDAGVRDE